MFDTDIGGDVDDVGALVILNNYVNQGKVELLAVGVCAYNPYSPGVIDSVCQYYGNTDVRIGQCDFNDEQIDYADKQLDIYSKPLYYDYYNRFSAGDEKPEQVIDMYRELLEKADDKSVVFISVGFLNNLYDLLESEPDKISPLTGRQLIQKRLISWFVWEDVFLHLVMSRSISLTIWNWTFLNIVNLMFQNGQRHQKQLPRIGQLKKCLLVLRPG